MPDAPSEELLRQFQAGDREALDLLWTRYLPRLTSWAHARLPPVGRHLADTDDLVQTAFLRLLGRLDALEARGPRTLYAYFKTVVMSQVRDILRHVIVRPAPEELLPDLHVDPSASPFEQLVGREVVDRYEGALATLSETDQDIVRAHVELGFTDRELMHLLDKPSLDAMRMARGRALSRLARKMAEMSREDDAPGGTPRCPA